MPEKAKGSLNKTMVRPVMYGVKKVAVIKAEEHKKQVVDMKMPRGSLPLGLPGMDKVRLVSVREECRLASLRCDGCM